MADNWIPLPPRSEGIEVLEDGTIMLNALRAQGVTYNATFNNTAGADFGKLIDIKPNKIRMTVAVPLDHCIKYGYKLPGAQGGLPTGAATGAMFDDFDTSAYVRTHYVKAPKYERWLRKDSWPTPGSIVDPTTGNLQLKADDKLGALGNPGAALRDDLVPLQNEAKRNLAEVGRVQGRRSIFLKGICLSYQPGDEIASIDSAKVNKTVETVILHCGGETQMTELILS